MCKNLQPRTRDVFFGHEPFGSFKNDIIHREAIIRDKQARFIKLKEKEQKKIDKARQENKRPPNPKYTVMDFKEHKKFTSDAFRI